MNKLAALLGVLALGLSVRTLFAEEARPTGTAIASGALLGAELVALTQTALHVDTPLSYVFGVSAGAALGGGAGYFVARETHPEVTDYVFASSVVLLIPTIVWISLAHEPNPRKEAPLAPKTARLLREFVPAPDPRRARLAPLAAAFSLGVVAGTF